MADAAVSGRPCGAWRRHSWPSRGQSRLLEGRPVRRVGGGAERVLATEHGAPHGADEGAASGAGDRPTVLGDDHGLAVGGHGVDDLQAAGLEGGRLDGLAQWGGLVLGKRESTGGGGSGDVNAALRRPMTRIGKTRRQEHRCGRRQCLSPTRPIVTVLPGRRERAGQPVPPHVRGGLDLCPRPGLHGTRRRQSHRRTTCFAPLPSTRC